MNDNFDRALHDLGFPAFGDDDLFQFGLKNEDGASMQMHLYRDTHAGMLRISVYSSRTIPTPMSQEFFMLFARAALEPFRDGIGVGIPEESDRLCVYFSLPVEKYVAGESVTVFEEMLAQIEKWDELLAIE